ncbi:MAG: hypothetical protein IJQ39_09565 [Thermoguttaceae bacterium]|nr:hypothetical protein [Thermoguttaceae bacterium]
MTFKPATFVLTITFLAALTSSLFADAVSAPAANEISQLIAQLGDDDYLVRNNAQSALSNYGSVIKAELEKALAATEDPEIYQRLQFLIKTIPLVWDEPGDEPELAEFIQKYRRSSALSKMVIMEELRRLPIEIQIKVLDRIIKKEQNYGSALFAAMAFWYWRPETNSPQFVQISQAINETWKDSKHPAAKNLYYLLNYKQIRAEATIWFDNQLQNMAELNRAPSKSAESIPEYIGAILAEFARRNAESVLSDADLAGNKRLTFSEPRYGYSPVVYVNGVVQPQLNLRSQVLSSLRSSGSLFFVPALGPIYLHHQGMTKDAGIWLNWEFSNPESLSYLERKTLSETLHEYDLNKAAADILEQKNIDKNAANKDSVLNLSTDDKGRLAYFRACQAKQENNPDKQWEFLLESIKTDKMELDALIMQWELCQIPAEENKIAAITDDVRKQVDENIEKLLSKLEEDINNSGINSYSLLNHYAWLAVKTNRHLDKALLYSKESVNIEPESGACMDTLAHCYAANGDLDKAIETQQKAVKQEPTSQVLYNNLLHFKKLKEAQR